MFIRLMLTGIGGILLAGTMPAQAPTKTQDIPSPATYREMNALLGLELWQDEALWDDDAHETAQRLRWPEESRTSYEASYRYYPDADYRVLEARPFSIALYADPDKVSGLSLVFANKGDSIQQIGTNTKDKQSIKAARQSLKNYAKAIKNDTAVIKSRLQQALGKAAQDQIGRGAKTKEQVNRWDWNSHAILLSAPRGEYIRIQIIPVELADVDGMRQRVNDKDFRQILAKRVSTRANGDVIITDIPMVWQGNKGYCVPATWERYLRYVGIPADMYVLALAGETQAGGGTQASAMAAGVSQLAHKYHRNIKAFTRPFNTRNVAKWINKGIPVMWCILADQEFYHQELTERARTRQAATGDNWKEQVKTWEHKAGRLRPDKTRGHMCMIIGYNPDTKEIAISDSWGPDFVERWLTQKEARVISRDIFYVIQW